MEMSENVTTYKVLSVDYAQVLSYARNNTLIVVLLKFTLNLKLDHF